MGYSPIYVVGRNRSKIEDMTSSFPYNYGIVIVDDHGKIESVPQIAIGTIPGDKPIDPIMRETICHIFERAQHEDMASGKRFGDKSGRVLLEMAYKPSVTPLMQLASDSGWTTIPGLEVLVGQGMYQVRFSLETTTMQSFIRLKHIWLI